MNAIATSVCVALWLIGASPQEKAAPAASAEPATPQARVDVAFRGWLPGNCDASVRGEFDVDFRIYLSPQGGEPVWRERRRVPVVEGKIDVALGSIEPIPMKVHEATFKFLGASVGGAREVYPRFPIVNTVFVAEPEARAAIASRDVDPAAAAYAPRARVETRTELAATWLEALIRARAAGADLPDYEDWYAALERCTEPHALERAGHYEWVLPWVYDTASHGRYNRYFRGRLQGCDYMDLSPSQRYLYRFATPLVHDASRSPAPSHAR